MGWFDEQIRQRQQTDNDLFSASFLEVADAVLGTKLTRAFETDTEKAKGAILDVMRYYHITAREIPDDIQGLQARLEYVMRPHGIMRRKVQLTKGWYRDAFGAMIGTLKADGTTVALIPTGLYGYSYFDSSNGKYVKIGKKNEDLFDDEAIVFYKSLPMKKLTVSDLLKYIFNILSVADYAIVFVGALSVALIGLLTPKLYNIIVGTVADSGDMKFLVSIVLFMAASTFAGLLISAVNLLFVTQIGTKTQLIMQAAAMSRLLSLPTDFFKKHNSGSLTTRLNQISLLCEALITMVFSTGLTSLFSLIYVFQLFDFAPSIAVPALLVIFTTIVFITITVVVKAKIGKIQYEQAAKEMGVSYALITGVQKIKLAGAEKRSFARWSREYSKRAKVTYNPPKIIKFNAPIVLLISSIGLIVIYYIAATSGVTVEDYYAFNIAYGMITGALTILSTLSLTAADIKPYLDMTCPLLETAPEIDEDRQSVTSISGGIELNNVSFRYTDDTPNVINNLTLSIHPGQYVAITGETGCGKSTLMRLLLGFETPDRGAIYYDGKDMKKLDLKSLRRNIGVVMQNGKLFMGDIYSNIVISAPTLGIEAAWEAAELAGIADDIRRMPMGMNTFICEGSGGISGGQRQRLMIARAIAPKPKILMLDEATSALDNITQKRVSDALDSLKSTRIVIAHRLSTIRQCDRIIYLENGRIIEDGTYDELMKKHGKFCALVERQQI